MKQLSIIGLSNAGKTCYIYAMAKTMIKGYNGLNAIAIDDNLRDQLREGWMQIDADLFTEVTAVTEHRAAERLLPVFLKKWQRRCWPREFIDLRLYMPQ